jgi:acyl transferase domain-containing protein
MDSAVAIIGMGARFPGAPDLAAYRRLLWEGRVERSPVPAERWDHAQVHSANPRHANRTPAQQGAFMTGIADFAPEFFGVTPKRARIMDPQQRLVLEISRQALEDAGYAQRRLAEGNVGVYVGASSSDHRTLMAGAVNIPCDLAGRSGVAPALTPEELAAVTAALPPIQGYSIVGQQLNMLAANVSQAFDFKGPAFALDTACSSALAALHEAVLHLRAGIVDAALVGGVYVQLDPIMMVCFSRVGAISFTDECRPFQAAADGFVLGEGVGMIVVKRLADAVAAGDRVLAVIRGIGMNNDGQGAGPLTPLASGQVAAMARAWQMRMWPGDGRSARSARHGDPGRRRHRVGGDDGIFRRPRRRGVPVTSVKANIGHGLASAGIASLIKATLAVQEGVVPPQPCAGPLRAEFAGAAAWLRVPTAREQWSARGAEPRRAGVSAFGFGGTNVHVVLEQAPAGARREKVPVKHEHRCVFSAPSKALLAAYLGHVEEAVRERSVALADVAFTLAQRRTDRVGTTIVAASAGEFFEKIAARQAALGRGESPADDAGGTAEAGALVWLPASPLAERRFWLMDEAKRRAAAAAPIREEAATEGQGARRKRWRRRSRR